MARAFQFRVGDEVTFTLFEREMSGKVIVGDIHSVDRLDASNELLPSTRNYGVPCRFDNE